MGGISDRKQEIKRRRHRRKKITHSSAAQEGHGFRKGLIAEKLRRLTPGCEVVIANLALEERE